MAAEAATPLYEDVHYSATVLVGRFRNEGALCSMTPKQQFAWLHHFYSVMDGMATQHGVFKLYGGAQGFLLATNVAEPDADHAATMLAFAEQLMRVEQLSSWLANGSAIRVPGQAPLDLALAMDSGPLASGLLGSTSLTYQVVGRPFDVARELADSQLGACIIVADGLRNALPDEAAAGLIPLDGVQLRCSPDQAVHAYSVPLCAAPPPRNTTPATPNQVASPTWGCLAPAGLKMMAPAANPASHASAASGCGTCGCGNVHADALLDRS